MNSPQIDNIRIFLFFTALFISFFYAQLHNCFKKNTPMELVPSEPSESNQTLIHDVVNEEAEYEGTSEDTNSETSFQPESAKLIIDDSLDKESSTKKADTNNSILETENANSLNNSLPVGNHDSIVQSSKKKKIEKKNQSVMEKTNQAVVDDKKSNAKKTKTSKTSTPTTTEDSTKKTKQKRPKSCDIDPDEPDRKSKKRLIKKKSISLPTKILDANNSNDLVLVTPTPKQSIYQLLMKDSDWIDDAITNLALIKYLKYER